MQIATIALSALSAVVSGTVAYHTREFRDLREKVGHLETAVAAKSAMIETNCEALRRIEKKLDDLSVMMATVDKRVVAIEANRFTSKDGLDVWQEINKIRGSLPQEFPPQEWRRRIEALEQRVQREVKP